MKRFALCLLVACSSPAPAPQSPPPAPTPAPEPAPTETPPAPEPAQTHPLGTPCADDDGCSGTQGTCVLYYGIAGPRGPQFRSCEIKCTADDDCPGQHRCVTIADGPGQVCRPIE